MLTQKVKLDTKVLWTTFIILCLTTIPTTLSAQTKQLPQIDKSQYEYDKAPHFIQSVFYKKCDSQTYSSTTSYKIKMKYQDESLNMESKTPRSGSVSIIKDKQEVYDCSYKQYKIESDAIDIEYTVYCYADRIVLTFNGKRFMIDAIDGGCDVHIKWLKHKFNYTSGTETMKIKVTKDLILFEDDNPYNDSLVLKKGSEFKFVTRDGK